MTRLIIFVFSLYLAQIAWYIVSITLNNYKEE